MAKKKSEMIKKKVWKIAKMLNKVLNQYEDVDESDEGDLAAEVVNYIQAGG